MPKIFISYRRNDVHQMAEQIYTKLVQHFSKEDVFKDMYSIQPGKNFRASIDKHLIDADVVLVLVGRLFNGQEGDRRLMERDDFVRLELEMAIRHEKRILPILMGEKTQFPPKESIPPELISLRDIQALQFPSPTTLSQENVKQLLDSISALSQSQAPSPNNPSGGQAEPRASDTPVPLTPEPQNSPSSGEQPRGPMNKATEQVKETPSGGQAFYENRFVRRWIGWISVGIGGIAITVGVLISLQVVNSVAMAVTTVIFTCIVYSIAEIFALMASTNGKNSCMAVSMAGGLFCIILFLLFLTMASIRGIDVIDWVDFFIYLNGILAVVFGSLAVLIVYDKIRRFLTKIRRFLAL